MALAAVRDITGPPLSIQGEREVREIVTTWMEQGDVDDYVAKASDGVVSCRERSRHFFPSIRTAGVRFSDEVGGYWIRVLPCGVCGEVERIERWETVGIGKRRRWVKHDQRLDYSKEYLAKKGTGRIRARQVQEALANQAMEGLTLTVVREQVARERAKVDG